jgi:hypothetical protein
MFPGLQKDSMNLEGCVGGVGGGSYLVLACAFAAVIVSACICACCLAHDGFDGDGTHSALTRFGATNCDDDIYLA